MDGLWHSGQRLGLVRQVILQSHQPFSVTYLWERGARGCWLFSTLPFLLAGNECNERPWPPCFYKLPRLYLYKLCVFDFQWAGIHCWCWDGRPGRILALGTPRDPCNGSHCSPLNFIRNDWAGARRQWRRHPSWNHIVQRGFTLSR